MERESEGSGGFGPFGRGVIVAVLVGLAWTLAVIADLMTIDGTPGQVRGLVVSVIALGVAWRVWKVIEHGSRRIVIAVLAGLPALVVGSAHVLRLMR
ncbi:MAG: hypothetical protein WEA76_01410 [Acidimicrobiia bacterium]